MYFFAARVATVIWTTSTPVSHSTGGLRAANVAEVGSSVRAPTDGERLRV